MLFDLVLVEGVVFMLGQVYLCGVCYCYCLCLLCCQELDECYVGVIVMFGCIVYILQVVVCGQLDG